MELHWIPVQQRVHFRLATITFNTTHPYKGTGVPVQLAQASRTCMNTYHRTANYSAVA